MMVTSLMKYALVSIEDVPLFCKVCDTDQERAQGLMNIAKLNPSEGCLFVFAEPEEIRFWMRNCLIPLQMITLNAEKEIIDIIDMDHTDPGKIHRSSQPVKYCIEANKDFFTDHNIKVGTKVQF